MKRKVSIPCAVALLALTPLWAKATLLDSEFTTAFFEGFIAGYEQGGSALIAVVENYGIPLVEDVVAEELGPLGLTSSLSIEEGVLEQAARGEHVLVLNELPRELIGETYARRVAVSQARAVAQSVLSPDGQERIVEKIAVVDETTDQAITDFLEADQAISSQTAIKRLARLNMRQAQLLSGLANEVAIARSDSAVSLEVLAGVAEQLDELHSVHHIEQRSQVESLLRVAIEMPVSLREGGEE